MAGGLAHKADTNVAHRLGQEGIVHLTIATLRALNSIRRGMLILGTRRSYALSLSAS